MIMLSFSSYSVFKKCPKQYQFKYIYKIRGPVRLRPFLEGSVAQKCMDAWWKETDMSNKDWLIPKFEEFFKSAVEAKGFKLDPGEDMQKVKKKSWDLLHNYVLALEQFKLLDKNTVRPDLWYARPQKPLPMTDNWAFAGAADYVRFTDKEGSSSDEIYDGKKSESDFFADRDQLYIYAVVHEKTLNRRVSQVHFILYGCAKPKLVTHSFTDVNRKEIVSKVDATAKSIKDNRFQAMPSELACKFCPYQDMCEDSIFKQKTSLESLSAEPILPGDKTDKVSVKDLLDV